MSSPEPTDKSKILGAGFRGRCPECLEGPLFEGYLKFAQECPSCGFDYHANDVADGPAVFVILLASIIVVPMALAFQIKLDAPIWLTLLIFVPAIIGVCLAMLRPFRGMMFALQIMNKAAPGELDKRELDSLDEN